MSNLKDELKIRLKGIEDINLRDELENSFNGRLEFENEINELNEKEEFKKFLSSWRYKSKIIYNLKLWKSHESDFFKLDNSYFLLNTEEDLSIFKEFLEKECQRYIQKNISTFSEEDISDIYEKYLENLNPPHSKETILSALKDVLEKKLNASYENIVFLTKKVNIDTSISKIEWYSKLGLSDDQVSVIYNKFTLCNELPEYKEKIESLAVNKFKAISHKHVTKDIQKKLLNELCENPKMTKKEIENRIDSYRIFDEEDISIILDTLKSSWTNFDKKTKKEISFQLFKIKEKMN